MSTLKTVAVAVAAFALGVSITQLHAQSRLDLINQSVSTYVTTQQRVTNQRDINYAWADYMLTKAQRATK